MKTLNPLKRVFCNFQSYDPLIKIYCNFYLIYEDYFVISNYIPSNLFVSLQISLYHKNTILQISLH